MELIKMIVNNIGYIKFDDLLKMYDSKEVFSIYETGKNTNILIKNTQYENLHAIYKVKEDRLPYKDVEGKKIVTITKQIFCSTKDSFDSLYTIKLNSGTQILAYEEFHLTF